MAGDGGAQEPTSTQGQISEIRRTLETLVKQKGPGYTSEEEAIRKVVSDTKSDVSSGINEVRQTAYTLSSHKTGWLRKPWSQDLLDNQLEKAVADDPCEVNLDKSIPREWADIGEWGRQIEECARKLQDKTEKINASSARIVLAITSRAGKLLGATERLLAAHERLVEVADATAKASGAARPPPPPPRGPGRGNSPSAGPPPPNPGPTTGPSPGPTSADRSEVLSRAQTVVFTARDHMTAAKGHARDVIAAVGNGEMWLLIGVLILLMELYFLWHPAIPGTPDSVPLALRPQYEVFFWSIFGAISISIITIATETVEGTFDPARRFKYVYKIPLAPVVAYGLLLFFGGVGQALTGAGEGGIGLEPGNPNFPVIILLSFLFGFFGKRSLDILDTAWDAIMARLPTGSGGSSGTKTASTTTAQTTAGGAKPAEPQPKESKE